MTDYAGTGFCSGKIDEVTILSEQIAVFILRGFHFNKNQLVSLKWYFQKLANTDSLCICKYLI